MYRLATIGVFAVLCSLLACRMGAASDPKASAGCSLEQLERGPHLQRSISVDGKQRDYLLEVPARVQPGEPVALLFAFHGWGHSSEGLWKQSRFRELKTKQPFITVFPQGLPIVLIGDEPEDGWEIKTIDGNRDLALTAALIDEIERNYCIDRKRIFVSGFSNGGYLSHLIGCAMGDRIAAIGPVGGGDLVPDCQPKRAMPVIIQHGNRDSVVPVDRAHAARDRWAKRNQCGASVSEGKCSRYRDCRDDAEVVYCEEEIGHSWPPAATGRIWDFFERHSLP